MQKHLKIAQMRCYGFVAPNDGMRSTLIVSQVPLWTQNFSVA